MGAYIDGRFIKLDNMQMKYVREITNNWDKEELEYQGLAPVYGEKLDDYLFDDGFYQWTSDEIQKAQ